MPRPKYKPPASVGTDDTDSPMTQKELGPKGPDMDSLAKIVDPLKNLDNEESQNISKSDIPSNTVESIGKAIDVIPASDETTTVIGAGESVETPVGTPMFSPKRFDRAVSLPNDKVLDTQSTLSPVVKPIDTDCTNTPRPPR